MNIRVVTAIPNQKQAQNNITCRCQSFILRLTMTFHPCKHQIITMYSKSIKQVQYVKGKFANAIIGIITSMFHTFNLC